MWLKGFLFSFLLFIVSCGNNGPTGFCKVNGDCVGDEVCKLNRCVDTKKNNNNNNNSNNNNNNNVNTKRQENQSCQGKDDCISGLACVGKDNAFFCRRFCSRSKDCSSGQGCYDLKGGSKTCIPIEGNGPPFDAKCKVKAHSASISGGSWDAFGGAPDPYVKFLFTNADNFVTTTSKDSFNPSWNESSKDVYSYQDIWSMDVSLIDEDVSENDIILTWTSKGQQNWKMERLEKSYSLSSQSGSIKLSISVSCELPQ